MLVLQEHHPARDELRQQTLVITPKKAQEADIRALRLGILNLMPSMGETEKDILRSLSQSVLQIEPVWLRCATHRHSGRHTSHEHIKAFYKTLEDATQHSSLDGLIVTGAPIEHLPFTEVMYWKELRQIMDYAYSHIACSLYLCWAAMAGAYHHFSISKVEYSQKLVGLFEMQNIFEDDNPFTRGMNQQVHICQSRSTGWDLDEVARASKENEIVPLLTCDETPTVLQGKELGVTAFASSDFRLLFNLGHLEYRASTIDEEVKRDRRRGVSYPVENYYLVPDKKKGLPSMTWKADRTLFFTNFVQSIYNQMNTHSFEHVPFALKL